MTAFAEVLELVHDVSALAKTGNPTVAGEKTAAFAELLKLVFDAATVTNFGPPGAYATRAHAVFATAEAGKLGPLHADAGAHAFFAVAELGPLGAHAVFTTTELRPPGTNTGAHAVFAITEFGPFGPFGPPGTNTGASTAFASAGSGAVAVFTAGTGAGTHAIVTAAASSGASTAFASASSGTGAAFAATVVFAGEPVVVTALAALFALRTLVLFTLLAFFALLTFFTLGAVLFLLFLLLGALAFVVLGAVAVLAAVVGKGAVAVFAAAVAYVVLSVIITAAVAVVGKGAVTVFAAAVITAAALAKTDVQALTQLGEAVNLTQTKGSDHAAVELGEATVHLASDGATKPQHVMNDAGDVLELVDAHRSSATVACVNGKPAASEAVAFIQANFVGVRAGALGGLTASRKTLGTGRGVNHGCVSSRLGLGLGGLNFSVTAGHECGEHHTVHHTESRFNDFRVEFHVLAPGVEC